MLADCLDRKKIILNLKAHALRQALTKMLSKSSEKAHKQILKDLMARESLMSTILGKGVALPRTVVEGKKKTEIIIALSKKGIAAHGFDRVPVRIVVLHLFAGGEEYSLLLAQSLRLLNEESLRTELFDCETEDDVIATIRKWEEE